MFIKIRCSDFYLCENNIKIKLKKLRACQSCYNKFMDYMQSNDIFLIYDLFIEIINFESKQNLVEQKLSE